MLYLVDTDWVIHHMNGVRRVTDRLAELEPDGLGLSIVSLAELYEGVSRSSKQVASERILDTLLAGRDVVDLDEETCRIFGRERGRLRAEGNLIGDLDLLIRATALRHGLTLLTNNRRHFERIDGLAIESV